MAISRPVRTLRIGELARASALSPDSIRHYERLGLLPRAARTTGGFREYPEEAVRRVRVIQRSLALGFTLAELAGIFRDRASGRAPCQRVRALAAEKLRALAARVAELEWLRTALAQTLAAWDLRLAGAAAGRPAGLLDCLADLDDDPYRPTTRLGPPRRVRRRASP
jgi:DNA-binding transcriptional MerR regulator